MSKNEIRIVKEHYDADPAMEWNRLEGFRYEFEITKSMLEKHMKKGSVLDIGGGPGRYSIYLAKLGYDVTLIDLSDKNIEFAKQKASEIGVLLKAYQCDARDLARLELDSFDNILIMGPFYHLSKESDREKCVREAKKHLKKDGVIFASFISLSGGLNYYLDECPEQILLEDTDYIDCLTKDIQWSGIAFTQATFIKSTEIEPFFSKLGIEKITLFGQEGVTATRLTYIENCAEEVRKYYLDLSLKLCENERYFPYSSHMMFVGRMAQ